MQELLSFIDVKTALTLVAGYFTMRADIKWLVKNTKEAKELATDAHERITKHVEDFHTTKTRKAQ